MEFAASAVSLLWHTSRRVYTLIPALLLDPFDIAERYFGLMYEVPIPVIWGVFSVGVFVAVALAHHDIRMGKKRLEQRSEQKTDIQRAIDGLARISSGFADQVAGSLGSYDKDSKEGMELFSKALELMRGSPVLGEGYVARFYTVTTSLDELETPEGLEVEARAQAACLNEFIRELTQRL